jgi:hypothetical protein
MARFTSPSNKVTISDIDIDPGETGNETINIDHGDGSANSYAFDLSLRAGETAFLRGFDNNNNKITGLPTRTYTNTGTETKTFRFTINVPQFLEDDLGNSRYLEVLIAGDISGNNNDGPRQGGSGEGNPPLNQEDSNNNTGDENDNNDGVANPTLSPGSGFGGSGDRTNITIRTPTINTGGGGTTNQEDSNNNTGDENNNNDGGIADPTFNPG